jgi:hypothetical protein
MKTPAAMRTHSMMKKTCKKEKMFPLISRIIFCNVCQWLLIGFMQNESDKRNIGDVTGDWTTLSSMITARM